MNTFSKIDRILKTHESDRRDEVHDEAYRFASGLSMIENSVVVVSDLGAGRSSIYAGRFGEVIGLSQKDSEYSIWEKEILNHLSDKEKESKFKAELRFYHYLRRIPQHRRKDFFLMTKLTFETSKGPVETLHRMYYIYEGDSEKIRYAVCVYGPLYLVFSGKSFAVNSVTGVMEEMSESCDNKILTRREVQTLRLIADGKKSAEIAETLSISVHTVSRHRQEIISKLQVRNSAEALKVARSMGLL